MASPSVRRGQPGQSHGDGNCGQSSMQRLWEGIHFSRLSIDNDRKGYEKARSEIESLNDKINQVGRQCAAVTNRIREVQELQAVRSTDLSHFEIKDRVVNDSLARVDEELRRGWDELSLKRRNTLELTSRYLKESTSFAETWNCTDLGRSNRKELLAKELEDLGRTKHRMEYDLEEFLVKLGRVKECKQEMVDLEKEFRGQETIVQNRETEAYKRLKDIDEVLDDLWKKQDTITQSCENEVSRLQQKIEQTRASISHWERRVSENQRTVEQQRCQIQKDRSPVSSSGITNRLMNQQLSEHFPQNANPISNKCAKIYQPVKPTVKATQYSGQMATTAIKKGVFQKPPAANSSLQQKSNYPFNKIDDSNYKPNANPSNRNSSNSVSLSSSTFFPSKSVTISNNANTTGRVFQFKKKSMDGSDNSPTGVISGPTQRSVTVSLGNTPFATFQNGRAVLQHQQRGPNHNDFSNDKR